MAVTYIRGKLTHIAQSFIWEQNILSWEYEKKRIRLSCRKPTAALCMHADLVLDKNARFDWVPR